MQSVIYAKCHLCKVSFMLSVIGMKSLMLSLIVLNVIMLSVIILIAVMLNVVAPFSLYFSIFSLPVVTARLKPLTLGLWAECST